MGKHARIEEQAGSYGFGHDWTLVLPARKAQPEQRFWLGDCSKFCSRVLGMDGRDLSYAIGEGYQPLRVYRESTMRKVADYIVYKAGGMRAIRRLEAWDLCGQ
jgi:hypothetical protein